MLGQKVSLGRDRVIATTYGPLVRRSTMHALLWYSILVLFIAFIIVLPYGTVLANSGPPRIWGDTGGPLLPGKSDQIHVLGEKLHFILDEKLDDAQVTALYGIENRGDALSNQPFIFVVQEHREDLDLMVSWQGVPIPVERVDTDLFTPEELLEMDSNWTTVDFWMNPVTGVRYRDKEFFGRVRAQYFHFAIDMPSNVRGELKVSYEQAGAYDRTLHAYNVYHYQYLLLPARGWASFGPLEIRVSAPKRSSYYFASNLDFQLESGEYVARLNGLPNENLAFAVMDKAGLIFGLTQPGPYYWMGFVVVLFLAAAVGWGAGRLAALLLSRRWALAGGVLGGLFLGGLLDIVLAVLVLKAIPALREQSYGIFLVGLGQGLAGAFVSAMVARYTVLRTWHHWYQRGE